MLLQQLISITIGLLLVNEFNCHKIDKSRVKRQDPGITAVFGIGADLALTAIDTIQDGFAMRGVSKTKLGEFENEKAGEIGTGRAVQRIQDESDEKRRRKRRSPGNEYDAELYEPGSAAGPNDGFDEENLTGGIEDKFRNLFQKVIGATVNGMKKIINWLSGDGEMDESQGESEQ